MKVIIVAACLCLAGCAAGPDYVRPALPPAARYAPDALPGATASAGGAAQQFASGQAVRAGWWQAFGSPQLDQLIADAFAASPTLAAARAALRSAQENVAAQLGAFYPTVSASYAPSRTKVAGNQGGSAPGLQGDGTNISTGPNAAPVIYTYHTAQLTIGYAPDVFGGNRRQVEAVAAQADVQAWALQAAYTTLATNLAGAAIQEALLREQIAITEDIVAAGTQSVAVLRRQQHAGFASNLDISLQEGALLQAQQALPPLQRQLAQTRNLLRALAGKAPDQPLVQQFDAASLHLPLDLPLSLPSQLVAQRPDVRAAEAQVQAASAQAGVAAAARLPQFSIGAAIGGAAGHVNQMFWPSGAFFSLAGNLTQPLFNGGALKHRQLAADAALQEAAAQYQATVLTAFQNVADTLRALHADADSLQVALAAEENAGASLALMRRQLARGYVDRLALIGAEQTRRQAALNVAQARANRLGDTAALFQALGGGWQPRAQ